MTATCGVVPADQLRRGRVEEDHAQVVTVGAQLADLGEHLGVLTAGHQRESVDVARGFGRQFDDRADQCRGQIVDHEPPEVLQHVGHPGASGAGQPGDQHDVGHAVTLLIPLQR